MWRQILLPETIDLVSPAITPPNDDDAPGARVAHTRKRSVAIAGLVHQARDQLAAVKRERADANNRAEVAEDRLLCKICAENQCCVVLSPCSHCVLCEGCANRVQECPICRADIGARQTMILS